MQSFPASDAKSSPSLHSFTDLQRFIFGAQNYEISDGDGLVPSRKRHQQMLTLLGQVSSKAQQCLQQTPEQKT